MAFLVQRLMGPALGVLALFGAHAARAAADGAQDPAVTVANTQACASLALPGSLAWPTGSTQIDTAVMRPAQTLRGVALPAHCEVIGRLEVRKGIDGQTYAIGLHLRLPVAWNERFLFQGGGGSNGVLGDALGAAPFSAGAVALAHGYAVVSQDSGHDNQRNNIPERAAELSFGFDPVARANYGHASLKLSADAAKAAIAAFYGRAPRYSYFAGCSKGGQEGMAFVQRYPEEFDGVLAGAPGFSLPRAAVAEAWTTQAFGRLLSSKRPTARDLAGVFSDGDLRLVQGAVLAACDADDGLADGVVGAFEKCSTRKVRRHLKPVTCLKAKTDQCLIPDQVAVLIKVFGGPKDSKGRSLYSGWAWDGGVAAPGWRFWTLGLSQAPMPAFNVSLGMGSLAAVFTTPPRALNDDQAKMDFAMAFDFDRDAARIYQVHPPFERSSWEDVSARSVDLKAFRARGGRLIVPHGVSDPVFSINDTLAWYRAVDAASGGRATDFVRVFPVPGMNHCGGGPATDDFDAFSALVDWVEQGRAPDEIAAKAGRDTPWPDRTRPLCPYPAIAVYRGRGDSEDRRNFFCAAKDKRGRLAAPVS
jgi:hypothetical protein